MKFVDPPLYIKLAFAGIVVCAIYSTFDSFKKPEPEPTKIGESYTNLKDNNEAYLKRMEDASKKHHEDLEMTYFSLTDQGIPKEYSSVDVYLETWNHAHVLLLAYNPKNKLVTSNDSILFKMHKKLISNQERYFPILRKLYAGHCKNELWRENIDVQIGGDRNKSITFTGAIFASNANIEDTQNKIHDRLQELRFTRVNYKWYEDASKYNYYTIDSEPDNK